MGNQHISACFLRLLNDLVGSIQCKINAVYILVRASGQQAHIVKIQCCRLWVSRLYYRHDFFTLHSNPAPFSHIPVLLLIHRIAAEPFHCSAPPVL